MKTWLFGECKMISKTLALNDVDLFKRKKDYYHESLVDKYCDIEEYPISYCKDKDLEYSLKYPHLWLECKKICHSFIQRRIRLMNRIQNMLIDSNGELKSNLFLTMTFPQTFIDRTTEKNRRKYISEFLRQFNVPYVANIDFGDNHEYIDRKGKKKVATAREHYHAILQAEKIDWSLYPYGRIHIERIYTSEKSKKKLATYVAKLTNHAIKESTKRTCLLYSRNFKKVV